MYNKRMWLNKEDSHFSSSMVCFHGTRLFGKETLEDAFIEITDCYHKIRLHVGDEYNYEDYIAKIEKIISGLSKYKKYLEQRTIYPTK